MSILKFLGLDVTPSATSSSSAETETVRKIVRRLDSLPSDQARYVAAFAYLLSRAAAADLDISSEETSLMERIVMKESGLPEELALLVVQIAKTQNQMFGATENYLVTREFERIATQEQKIALLECLFAVTAADEDISNIERDTVKQIAGELKLSRADYLVAQTKFRAFLSVLKPKT